MSATTGVPKEDKDGEKHVAALDGLRGLAILLVILCHSNTEVLGPFATSAWKDYYTRLTAPGWVGVDLFFVLSGFLITGILLRSKGSEHYFRNFYARRVLRIFPLYYLFAAAVFVAGRFSPTLHASHVAELSIFFFCYNFWSVYSGIHLALLHPFWSLCVEEHFYQVWPLLIKRLEARTISVICVWGFGLTLLCRIVLLASKLMIFKTPTLFAVYLLTPCRLDGLCAGSWLAAYHFRQGSLRNLFGAAKATLFLSALAIVFIAVRSRHFVDTQINPIGRSHSSRLVMTIGVTLLAVFFASLLVRSFDQSLVKRVFEMRLLRWFGKYSYGMYVFHTLGYRAANGLLFRTYPHFGMNAARSMGFSVCLIITSGMAFASFNLLESRLLALKRYFPSRTLQPG